MADRGVVAVRRVCETEPDARQLRIRLLEELRKAIGFDAYAFLLTDPQTNVGTSPLAEIPVLHDIPRAIGLKYRTEVNRWTKLNQPVALLREETGDDRSRSLLWRDLLHGYGIGDVASLVFRDRFGCWGFLDLWRAGDGSRFSRAEANMLRDVAPDITKALRASQARTFAVPPDPVPSPGPAVLLLAADLTVRGQTPHTHDYLQVLVPSGSQRAPVPASAYNVAAQVLAVEAGVDDNPPWARAHLAGGVWLTLRAARLGNGGPAADIAVTIEESSPGQRVDMFVRSHGLSAREGELLGHLAGGADTREVAERMHLSLNTVQDHLKSIFHKTGANSRRILLARAAGR